MPVAKRRDTDSGGDFFWFLFLFAQEKGLARRCDYRPAASTNIDNEPDIRMSETIAWLPDGTPYSPRFQDRYRSELGGLSQAREVFLQGCALPEAWAHAPQWRILETGFGLGLNFLVTWDAWRRDPARPRLLHFVSTEAWPASAEDLLKSFEAHPELRPLAEQLHAQWWGLVPGWHRLVFEAGQVVLTLCIGDAQAMLREMAFEADTVYLDGFSPDVNPDIWSAHTMKAVARLCRRGARVASWTVARSVRDALKQAGFVVQKTEGVPPKRHNLQGRYDPHWEPRKAADAPVSEPVAAADCIVIGSGIAGAAVANSLARRGWRVRVLDAGDSPAAGASGLPAGLVAPHISADDNVLSQLSRAGVRASLQCAERLLREEADWSPSGVLQHHVAGAPARGAFADDDAQQAWGSVATPEQLDEAHLPAGTAAHWHAKAAWLQPARLVQALLAHEAIAWQGGCEIAEVRKAAHGWQLIGADGACLAEAALVVVATGASTAALTGTALPLQPVRGQVSWGRVSDDAAFPPFPCQRQRQLHSGRSRTGRPHLGGGRQLRPPAGRACASSGGPRGQPVAAVDAAARHRGGTGARLRRWRGAGLGRYALRLAGSPARRGPVAHGARRPVDLHGDGLAWADDGDPVRGIAGGAAARRTAAVAAQAGLGAGRGALPEGLNLRAVQGRFCCRSFSACFMSM